MSAPSQGGGGARGRGRGASGEARELRVQYKGKALRHKRAALVAGRPKRQEAATLYMLPLACSWMAMNASTCAMYTSNGLPGFITTPRRDMPSTTTCS